MTLLIPPDPVGAKRSATARRYKREGYRVAVPPQGDPVPTFLDGAVPDIIAERDDDRVVIEIKRADQVAGSNELVALAERVERESGWRLEFISVPPPVEIDLWSEGSLDTDVIGQLVKQGAYKAAFLIRFAEMENVLSWAAAAGGRRLRPDPVSLAADLVSCGELPEELLREIKRSSAMRNKMVHGVSDGLPSRSDVLSLGQLLDRLRREVGDAHRS